jgi:hypothetical protein
MHVRQRQTLDGCLASVRFEFQKHTLHRAQSTKSGAALVNFVVISRQNRGAHKNSNGPHVCVFVRHGVAVRIERMCSHAIGTVAAYLQGGV